MPRIRIGFPVGRFVLGLVLAFSAPGGSTWAAPERPIVVGTEIGFPPYVDVDEEGRSTGFAVELFAAVAAVMDIQASYRPDRWDTVWRGLQSGEFDALPLAARLPEREGLVEFTRPHTLGYDSFFVRKGRSPIASLAQARALSVVVLRSDASHHALASRGFQRQLVPVDSLADGFRLLASGQHDAVLAPLLQGNMLVKALGVATVVEPGPLLKEYRREFCFAVRKGDTELRDRLDEGLAIVKANGEYDRLYRKWLGIYEPYTFPVRYVAWGGGVALILLALLGLWTWQLRRQVALRTAELSRAAAAVQTERQRLHDVLQKLPVYVVLLSADFRVSFANRFFEERYGMPRGRRCFEHLFSLGVPCAICETYKVLQTNAPVNWAWTGPDGRDYDIYDYPFTDSDGSPMVLQVGIDVTEKNRARQALSTANLLLERRVAERTAELEATRREAEQARDLLQMTMDNAPALISYIDAECHYRRVNQCYEQWFGLKQEEIVGRSMREVLGEAGWQCVADYVGRVLAGERVAFEVQVPYIQGGTRWMDVTYSPDCNAAGRVRGFVVHALDISERKERELELRRYRDILESARDLVGSTTPDGRVFYLNSAGRELAGIPPGESNLGVIADYHPPETADTIVGKILPVCAELGHW
ncbi:MAG TPA: transporter substrate-binding domain-containing protein [Methylococcaceae bacterium]|nr:transporter substrate-binding domain-containing protein [Methylococcaceae bacterium]